MAKQKRAPLRHDIDANKAHIEQLQNDFNGLRDRIRNFVDQMNKCEDIDPKCMKIINDNFWDLLL